MALVLTTEGAHVTGVLVDGGACRLDAPRRVMLEGEFQGSVLVGKLTLCQTGEQCPEPVHTYPILGFYSAEDQALVAHVRLSEGCQSPALRSGRFVLVPARKEATEAPTSTTSSALEVASKRNVRDSAAAKRASEQGNQFYIMKNYPLAVQHFELSLVHDSERLNWPAYLGLGSSRLKMGQVDAAIKDLERALGFNRREPKVLYMLGCAYSQKGEKTKALELLDRAVRLGCPLHEYIDCEAELKQSLGNEPRFLELLKRSREKNQQAQSRGKSGPGNQSP